MNLFYLDEHKACSNYSNAIQEGFIHYRVDAGKSYADERRLYPISPERQDRTEDRREKIYVKLGRYDFYPAL